MSMRSCLIGGKQVPTTDSIPVVDPATGQVIATTARGGAAEIDAAVGAAHLATGAWPGVPPRERSDVLRRLAGEIQSAGDELAMLESQDTGKPLTQARADVTTASRYFEFYANALETLDGRTLPTGSDMFAYTVREPFGVTGHIIPWNYPLQIGCRTIAPALAVGNCAVVKPAEEAPLSVIRLGELALEAGLPAGVLNIVPGLGVEAGAALARHPGIDHLSFTGSLSVGAQVAGAAAVNVVPTALELGGKSPNIVFADADLNIAVPAVVRSAIQNAGQTCSAGSRLLIHESVAEQVISEVSQAFATLRIGRGAEDPDLGPLISEMQREQVARMVERAVCADVIQHGGPGAIAVPNRGYFFPPTLLSHVDPTSEIAREEVFGPVVAATTFASRDEAIALANGTEYGLIAAVWTTSLDTAHTTAREIHAGQVFINNYGAGGGVEFAFGGVKKSGYGREKGREALEAFTQTKTVVMRVGS